MDEKLQEKKYEYIKKDNSRIKFLFFTFRM